jgi:hypothetical protein
MFVRNVSNTAGAILVPGVRDLLVRIFQSQLHYKFNIAS